LHFLYVTGISFIVQPHPSPGLTGTFAHQPADFPLRKAYRSPILTGLNKSVTGVFFLKGDFSSSFVPDGNKKKGTPHRLR
jgi:hypothetical protein